MTNDLKWAISSDQQIPYHDPRAIELWFKVLKSFKPDVVDYLGDTDDQACYSRWTDGRPVEFLQAYKDGNVETIFPMVESEARGAREFYQQTRKMLPKAQLFTALGNHDVRVFDYFDKKMPAALTQVTPESLWGLDSLGYEYIYYGDMPKQRFGDIHVHHGVAISQHAGESVRKDVENFGVSIIRGHSHRAGSFFRTYELRNETLRGYEIGHMSDIKSEGMSYTNMKNWQQGFAIAHIENGVHPHIQFIHISPDYSCYVDGKKYQA
jgi:hypothetical protein